MQRNESIPEMGSTSEKKAQMLKEIKSLYMFWNECQISMKKKETEKQTLKKLKCFCNSP